MDVLISRPGKDRRTRRGEHAQKETARSHDLRPADHLGQREGQDPDLCS